MDVLDRAIEMRGTSVDDYVDADGLRGGFQNALSVYGRLGEPCVAVRKTDRTNGLGATRNLVVSELSAVIVREKNKM